MKNLKRKIAVFATIGALAVTGTVFADTIAKTPADILSALTGKTTTALYEERQGGKTFGTIARDAGKLEEFKSQNLEQKKLILDQRVKDGKITQKAADATYEAIKGNQAACDGTGTGAGKMKIGQKNGHGMGNGNGNGRGMNR